MVSKLYRAFLASRKGKPVDTYAVQKKALAEFKTVKEYEQNKQKLVNAAKTEKFEQTRGGRVLERLKGGITKALYNQQKPNETTKEKLKTLKLQIQLQALKNNLAKTNQIQVVRNKILNNARMQQQQKAEWNQLMSVNIDANLRGANFFNETNFGDLEASRINKIISSVGLAQHNLPISDINKEVYNLSNFQHNLPMITIDKDANLLSFGQHNRALFDVSREADLLSNINILGGQPPKHKKRRFT